MTGRECAYLAQLFGFFAEDNRLTVYAGKLEVAPTTSAHHWTA